ncbi:GNAT family N-acetyltransferase [Nonomuraea spiralis]|uniref:GNAT family N-acetyltransferase n=1 Tax=Nonomuraea TaxID=83681 RepID=UPI000F769BC5|nr:GNAT family N-acetyltransferase [Nonomuraea sp. WAC 01424]RSM98746.1 alanine acetyltransferase [Nonomuraea sp. WAC 01424]
MINSPVKLTDDVVMRAIAKSDAHALADAYRRNRDFLRPWEPRRPDDFFTVAGQAARLERLAEDRAAGFVMPWVLMDGDRLVGRMNLNSIIRGAAQSASLGYWVDAEYNGRGLATKAVLEACRAADEDLALHRVEAGTLLHNTTSQAVLRRTGFEEYGMAPRAVCIDGQWQDHTLFQRILNDRPAPM